MTQSTFPTILTPSPHKRRPLVVSVPHSGLRFPDDERHHYAVEPETLLADGDLYVDELYAGAEELGATVIRTPWNRFVVDLNRLPDDLSPRSVLNARRTQGEGYYGDRGLIWAVTTSGQDIYREPLPEHLLASRLRRFYHPYHDALRTTLEDLRNTFGFAILLDAHSMPSRARSMHSDPDGKRRSDIVPGDLDGRSCARILRDVTVDFWRSQGYSVTPNRPYRGGGITRRHAAPESGIHALQLELRRGLYMDETSLKRLPEASALHKNCLGYVRALANLSIPSA